MDSKDSLNKILRGAGKPKPEEEIPLAEEEDELSFSQMDGQYSKLRPANKSLPRLHVIHKDGKVDTLYYPHLDAKSEFHGSSFTFIFAGAKLWELTVEGRNLWRIYDYIALQRWPYIRVSTRDFDEKGEVVTAVRIKDVTPKAE